MKKLLILLMLPILLIPMVVKADMTFVRPLLNDNVVVDGEIAVFIPLEYITDYNFTISYDPTMLETSKEMITTTHETSFVQVEGGGTKEEKNIFDVTVENGKITIKASAKESYMLYNLVPEPIVTIKFKALKAGKTVISFGGSIMNPSESEITINEKKCPACPTSDDNDTTETTDKEQEKEQEQEPTNAEEKPKENEKENKDMLFYISLGANGLLLITVIVLIFMNKSKKNKIVE
ncbi:MAG: hypothetical protein IKH36_00330 [Bacilli bacterium]|nr:hypothetical protein [Bacilli bacterium]